MYLSKLRRLRKNGKNGFRNSRKNLLGVKKLCCLVFHEKIALFLMIFKILHN